MTDTRRAYTPNDFCAAYGIGRRTFYQEVKAGRLPVRKLGTKTLVAAGDAEIWFDGLPRGNGGVDVGRNVARKEKV